MQKWHMVAQEAVQMMLYGSKNDIWVKIGCKVFAWSYRNNIQLQKQHMIAKMAYDIEDILILALDYLKTWKENWLDPVQEINIVLGPNKRFKKKGPKKRAH